MFLDCFMCFFFVCCWCFRVPILFVYENWIIECLIESFQYKIISFWNLWLPFCVLLWWDTEDKNKNMKWERKHPGEVMWVEFGQTNIPEICINWILLSTLSRKASSLINLEITWAGRNNIIIKLMNFRLVLVCLLVIC